MHNQEIASQTPREHVKVWAHETRQLVLIWGIVPRAPACGAHPREVVRY